VNIKIVLKQKCEGVGFLRLVQDRDTWRAFVNTVMKFYVLLTVLPSRYNFCKWPSWRTILFLYVYFNTVHVSRDHVLIIRRISCINTTSGMCRSDRLVRRSGRTRRSPTQEWHIPDVLIQIISWWWTRGRSKHVENWNEHIEKDHT
jgi:hypothetical protein